MQYTFNPIAKIIVAVVIIVLAGLGGYYVGRQKENTITPTPTTASTIPVVASKTDTTATTTSETTKTAATTPDPTEDWKTYEISPYGIKFKYPSDWPTLTTTVSKATADMPWEVSKDSVTFGSDNTKNTFVDLTDFTSIKDGVNKSDSASSDLDQMVKVFTDRKVGNISPFLLPPTNAALIVYSPLKYIENKTGTYRGIYYYALVAQNSPDKINGATQVGQFVAILTNGKDKLFQLNDTPGDYFKPDNSKMVDLANCKNNSEDQKGQAIKCVISQDLLNNFDSQYSNLIGSIN